MSGDISGHSKLSDSVFIKAPPSSKLLDYECSSSRTVDDSDVVSVSINELSLLFNRERCILEKEAEVRAATWALRKEQADLASRERAVFEKAARTSLMHPNNQSQVESNQFLPHPTFTNEQFTIDERHCKSKSASPIDIASEKCTDTDMSMKELFCEPQCYDPRNSRKSFQDSLFTENSYSLHGGITCTSIIQDLRCALKTSTNCSCAAMLALRRVREKISKLSLEETDSFVECSMDVKSFNRRGVVAATESALKKQFLQILKEEEVNAEEIICRMNLDVPISSQTVTFPIVAKSNDPLSPDSTRIFSIVEDFTQQIVLKEDEILHIKEAFDEVRLKLEIATSQRQIERETVRNIIINLEGKLRTVENCHDQLFTALNDHRKHPVSRRSILILGLSECDIASGAVLFALRTLLSDRDMDAFCIILATCVDVDSEKLHESLNLSSDRFINRLVVTRIDIFENSDTDAFQMLLTNCAVVIAFSAFWLLPTIVKMCVTSGVNIVYTGDVSTPMLDSFQNSNVVIFDSCGIFPGLNRLSIAYAISEIESHGGIVTCIESYVTSYPGMESGIVTDFRSSLQTNPLGLRFYSPVSVHAALSDVDKSTYFKLNGEYKQLHGIESLAHCLELQVLDPYSEDDHIVMEAMACDDGEQILLDLGLDDKCETIFCGRLHQPGYCDCLLAWYCLGLLDSTPIDISLFVNWKTFLKSKLTSTEEAMIRVLNLFEKKGFTATKVTNEEAVYHAINWLHDIDMLIPSGCQSARDILAALIFHRLKQNHEVDGSLGGTIVYNEISYINITHDKCKLRCTLSVPLNPYPFGGGLYGVYLASISATLAMHRVTTSGMVKVFSPKIFQQTILSLNNAGIGFTLDDI